MPDFICRSSVYNLRFMVWTWLGRQVKGQKKLKLTQLTAGLVQTDPVKASIFGTAVKNFISISIRKYFFGNTVVSLRPILFRTVSFWPILNNYFAIMIVLASNATHHRICINGIHHGSHVSELLNAICRGRKRKIYFFGTCMLRRLFALYSR